MPKGINMRREIWYGIFIFLVCFGRISFGENNPSPVAPALARYAADGDLKKVKELSRNRSHINDADELGRTALMWAAIKGRTAIVKELLKAGAQRSLKAKDGKLAADYAREGNFTEVVAALGDVSTEEPGDEINFEVTAQDFREVDSLFTFHHQPIHPQVFLTMLASGGAHPAVVAIDLAATQDDKNYFVHEVETTKAGEVRIPTSDGAFSYRWRGRLPNGLHVITTAGPANREGAMNILFVRFRKELGYLNDNRPYTRLMVSLVRVYTLGERDRADIKLVGPQVRLEITQSPSGKKTTQNLNTP
jgi:hypothetical protein